MSTSAANNQRELVPIGEMEDLIARAQASLSSVDEPTVAVRLVEEGVDPRLAYLATMAASILQKDKEDAKNTDA